MKWNTERKEKRQEQTTTMNRLVPPLCVVLTVLRRIKLIQVISGITPTRISITVRCTKNPTESNVGLGSHQTIPLHFYLEKKN